MPIDTADTVFHRPSGETWSVALIAGDISVVMKSGPKLISTIMCSL